MAEKSRGTALTIFAVLFLLLAISDFLKPFHLEPNAGFVFLGHKLAGRANGVMGPLFGFLLVVYSYGIWTMRRWALPVAYIFTGWVTANMVLFVLNNPNQARSPVAGIATLAVGIGIPLAAAIILSRRSAELA